MWKTLKIITWIVLLTPSSLPLFSIDFYVYNVLGISIGCFIHIWFIEAVPMY
jgi:hypothetical protein